MAGAEEADVWGSVSTNGNEAASSSESYGLNKEDEDPWTKLDATNPVSNGERPNPSPNLAAEQKEDEEDEEGDGVWMSLSAPSSSSSSSSSKSSSFPTANNFHSPTKSHAPKLNLPPTSNSATNTLADVLNPGVGAGNEDDDDDTASEFAAGIDDDVGAEANMHHTNDDLDESEGEDVPIRLDEPKSQLGTQAEKLAAKEKQPENDTWASDLGKRLWGRWDNGSSGSGNGEGGWKGIHGVVDDADAELEWDAE